MRYATLYAGNISQCKIYETEQQGSVSDYDLFHESAEHFPEQFYVPDHSEAPVQKYGRSNGTADSEFIPIGTGPYQVTDYNELDHIILQANSNYRGGEQPKNTLHFQVIPDKRNAINLMDVNNISVTFSKEIDRDTIYSNKDVNVVNYPLRRGGTHRL